MKNKESEAPSKESKIDALVNKLIDNVEISVKNVYLRYEDNLSSPNFGTGSFSMGILLEEIRIFTDKQGP